MMDNFPPEKIIKNPIQPIYSLEAETAVLGAVLINPEVFKTLDLRESDFYLDTNKRIWSAYQEITMAGGMIDTLTVGEKIKSTDLMKLVTDVPSSLHAKEYAEIVREKSRRRELVQMASDMARMAYDPLSDLEDEIPAYMTRLISGAKMATGAEHVKTALSELYSEIKARYEDPKDIWGIATGFYDYDVLTGGHHKGELTLLSGKPGLGKSIIAMQMAVGMSVHAPGVIYEMEMGRTQTIRRAVSNEARVETRRMRSGRLVGDDWEQIMNAIDELEKLPVFISDFTGWTTASMRADLARLKAVHGIEWFVVDYLYLLQDRYGKDDHERLAYVSKSLKNICKDLDLCGLVIHSMTKAEMESHNPGLAGMRGSGQIAYDADVVVYLVEDEFDKTNNVKLQFVKFREDTPDRYVKLQRDNGFPGFKGITRQEKTFTTPYKD